MSFKRRVVFSFGLFILLVAGLGGWLFVNGLREEKAFQMGRNSIRVQYMVQDMEYFINRKFRAIENYVMLEDDAEKLQIRQTEATIKKQFSTWERWAIAGEAQPEDLSSVKSIHEEVSRIGDKILRYVDKKRRMSAIRLVDAKFVPKAIEARRRLAEIKEKTIQDTIASEELIMRVVKGNRITSLGGIFLACILGIVLAMYLYNSVMLPMKVISMWTQQISKGNMQVSLNFPGSDEMSTLAKDFNDMVQNLVKQQSEKEQVKEEKISTLEDAVDGFREVLDIMGSAPVIGKRERKSHKI